MRQDLVAKSSKDSVTLLAAWVGQTAVKSPHPLPQGRVEPLEGGGICQSVVLTRAKVQPFRQRAYGLASIPACPTNAEPDLVWVVSNLQRPSGKHGDLVA